MSRNLIDVPQGQVTGRQLLQPSADQMQNHFNASFLPTLTGNTSANFVGRSKGAGLRQYNKNIDINGLAQPRGYIGNPKSHVYISNVTGIDPMRGGSLSTGLKADLSKPIKYTSRFNLQGFEDGRALGLLNERRYRLPQEPADQYTDDGRIKMSRGKYTTLTAGIGNIR
jgi:hypothetical protein